MLRTVAVVAALAAKAHADPYGPLPQDEVLSREEDIFYMQNMYGAKSSSEYHSDQGMWLGVNRNGYTGLYPENDDISPWKFVRTGEVDTYYIRSTKMAEHTLTGCVGCAWLGFDHNDYVGLFRAKEEFKWKLVPTRELDTYYIQMAGFSNPDNEYYSDYGKSLAFDHKLWGIMWDKMSWKLVPATDKKKAEGLNILTELTAAPTGSTSPANTSLATVALAGIAGGVVGAAVVLALAWRLRATHDGTYGLLSA